MTKKEFLQDTLPRLESMQVEIGCWHLATFPEASNKRIARKLLEESAEFMVAVSETAISELPTDATIKQRREEAADVLMVLMAWAHRNDVDLLAEVRRKFEIVRKRDQASRE